MNKIEEVVDNLNTRLWGMNGDENSSHVFIYTKAGFIENISLNLKFETYSIKFNDLPFKNLEDSSLYTLAISDIWEVEKDLLYDILHASALSFSLILI